MSPSLPQVLIVEGEPGAADFLVALINREGQQATKITFSAKVLEGIQQSRADLIILDWAALVLMLEGLRKAHGHLGILIDELRKAQARLEVVSGFVAICSHCKKVRRTDNSWQSIESTLDDLLSVQFSHSLCPDHREMS